MKPTGKDIAIKRIMSLPPEQVSKMLAFVDALKSMGGGAAATLMKGGNWKTENQIGGGGKERNILL